MNNIFDKKRNDIFYTPINGEVYECKFNSVCIKVSGCTDNALLGTGIISLNMDNYMFPIISMSLILADSTEPVDATSGVFSPTKIYRTFDDCIKDNNPLFKQDETYGLLLNTCVIFDTIAGEFTPKKRSGQQITTPKQEKRYIDYLHTDGQTLTPTSAILAEKTDRTKTIQNQSMIWSTTSGSLRTAITISAISRTKRAMTLTQSKYTDFITENRNTYKMVYFH